MMIMKSLPRIKIDLHVHTDHSSDSKASPKSVVKRAIELGFDAIAVTDHNTVSGALEAEKHARKTQLLVIPGQEVRAKEGEVIVLGVRETIPNRMPVLDTMKQARKMGGFVIVPHPFDTMRKGLGRTSESCLKYIDAVEVFNSRTMFSFFNNRALAFAEKYNLPMTVGSDSHFLEEMGKSYMLLESRKTTTAILDALHSGKAELVMKNQSRVSKLKRGLLKIRTRF
jgi:predicted metal-dependent phosphoesterase TrpH